MDDQGYRWRVLQQINRQEGRHCLARAVFYGQKGNCASTIAKGRRANWPR